MQRPRLVLVTLALAALAAAPLAAQFWRGAAAVGVEVKDGRGRALAGARVAITFRGLDGPGGPPAVLTDDRGRAAFVDLAAGSWNLEASHPDHLSYVAALTLRPGKKAEITASFLQATGPGRQSLRVNFFRATASIGSPAPVEAAAEEPAPAEPPAPPAASPPQEPPVQAPAPPAESAAPPAEPRLPPAPQPVQAPGEEVPPQEPESPPERPVTAEPEAAPEPPAEPEPDALPDPVAEPEPAAVPPPRAPEPPPTPETQRPEPEPLPTAPPAVAAPPPSPTVDEADAGAEPASARTEAPRTEPPATPGPELPAPEPAVPPAPQPPAPTPEPPVAEPPRTQQPPPSPAAPQPEAAPHAETRVPPLPVVPPPSPAVGAEPEPAAEPRPAPAPTRPHAPRPEAPPLRSFSDRTCPECKPGEWAATAEALLPRGVSGCPDGAAPDLRPAMRVLASDGAAGLDRFAGQALGRVRPTALELASDGARRRVENLLENYGSEDSGCRVLAVALPAGARFVGFRFEAIDDTGTGDCVAGSDCPIGDSAWLANPAIVRGSDLTVIFAVFENRSAERTRKGRLIAYFEPPRGGWRPPP